MIKSVKIGDYQTENNLFVAPLAGFTDFAFREACLSLGAGLVYTEMVSAKALKYGSLKTQELLTGNYDKTCAQIFGSEPDVMRWACESEYLAPFKIVDINFYDIGYYNKQCPWFQYVFSVYTYCISFCFHLVFRYFFYQDMPAF